MAQRVVTSWLNTVTPGAYNEVTVLSQPVGLGQSGILVIMGEADGGPSYTEIPLKGNSFTPAQLTAVQNMYISGQIVDAFAALTAPSNDANITGSANQIYIVKTNTSSQASATVAANTASPSVYGVLRDQNYGVRGNNYNYQVTALQTETPPAVIGGTIASYGSLSGSSFTVRLNGGAATLITLMGVITNVATLVTSLNNAFTTAAITTLTAAPNALSPTNSIQITVNADTHAYSEGYGKALELIDSTPGDLAALGLIAGISFSAAEPEIEVQINNASTGLSETLDVTPDVALMVGYQGTTATLTINQTTGMLTTTVTGGAGANLSLTLSTYKTIAILAGYINSQPGYTAIAAPSAQQQPPSALDSVTAIGIASTGAGDMPGRVKDSLATFESVLATSLALNFTPTATTGLPAPMTAPAYLTGGARGGTLAADIVNALDQIDGVNCNIIVPLFSEDATADIALGLTDPSSTYTIAAINAGTKNHCIADSTPELKRNRICVLSYWTNNYTNAAAAAQGLANYRCSLTMQQATQVNALGVITTFMPWYTAVIAAGMQAGGFYKSICNKLANVISFTDPSGFDSGNPGDVEAALSAGLLFLTANTAGSLWVSDQTTYGFDTNFVYNSIQAVYASDIIALDLTASFQSAFVGQSLADVDAASALGYLSQKMEGYKKLKLIAASDDAPLGYKNASVSILAPTMYIQVEIKLATAIYFIPISINVSQVQSTAS